MGEASWSLCALCPVPPEDQELHAWAVGGEAPRVSPVDVPTGSPGRGLRGAQRQTGARRQTEEVGCCREGVRREDKHPWTPPQRQRGTHGSPGTDSQAFPPVILMRPMLFYEPPRAGEPGEGGVSDPSPGPSPSQGSHAALLPHCLDSVYATSSRKSSRCSLPSNCLLCIPWAGRGAPAILGPDTQHSLTEGDAVQHLQRKQEKE